MSEAAAIGRPTIYSDELAETICQRLARGESLRSICDGVGMPHRDTVFSWAAKIPAFSDQYARAQEMSADADADDVAHYARAAATGKLEPAAATAAINGLKWSAGKRKPKKYGDAMQMKHSGAIGRFDASRYTDEQLERLEGVLGDLALADGDAGGGEGGEVAPGL